MLEISLHLDVEVELANALNAIRVLPLPVFDVHELRDIPHAPAGLFLDLAAQRRQQVLTHVHVAADDVPTVREEGPTRAAPLDEHPPAAVADQRSDRTCSTVALRSALRFGQLNQAHAEILYLTCSATVPTSTKGISPAWNRAKS